MEERVPHVPSQRGVCQQQEQVRQSLAGGGLAENQIGAPGGLPPDCPPCSKVRVFVDGRRSIIPRLHTPPNLGQDHRGGQAPCQSAFTQILMCMYVYA